MLKILLCAVANVAFCGTSVLAADMVVKAPPRSPPVQALSWTGFYVGGTAGGAWSVFHPTTTTVFVPTGYFFTTSVPVVNAIGAQTVHPSGFTGGVEAGYNWQWGHAVFGLETISSRSA